MATSVGMWRASMIRRLTRGGVSSPLETVFVSSFSMRYTMGRMERINAVIALLNNAQFMARCHTNPRLAMLVSGTVAIAVDGPSASLFRDAHSHTIRMLARSYCPETENRPIHLSHALSLLTRVNAHIEDQVATIVSRLLRRIEQDAETLWYTERELGIICNALARFSTQCFRDFVLRYADRELFLRVMSLLDRRYGTRPVVQELRASAFVIFPIDDQVRLTIDGRKMSARARSLILGCFCKGYSQTRYPTQEEVDGFALLVPHICQPEIITVSHTHISNAFAYSLGTFINAYQSAGREEDAANVLRLARLMWEHVPPSHNIRDRSYATRLSLLAGVPWLRPTTEELKRAIAPLRYAYAFNILPSLRGLRVVASVDNAPRTDLADVIEQLICDNLHLINLTDVRFVLRQIADPRVPVTQKVVDKVLSYVQGTTSFDADDLSMLARLINYHAPQEYHRGLLTEVVRQFVASVPNSSVSALSLSTIYDITVRNNLHSKAFFEKATQYNKVVAERVTKGESSRIVRPITDIQNYLHYGPHIMDLLKPSMRVQETRDFMQSLIDLGCAMILNEKTITPPMARRILHFTACIAIVGTPGRNVNAVMRPVLQHLMTSHVVTSESLSGFTRSVSQAYRKSTSSQEGKRLFPVLNLFCTVMLRNQFLIAPVTATYAISLILKRGSVSVEPVNRSHQETIRVCANVIARPEHRARVMEVLAEGNASWVSDLIGNSHLLDFEARQAILSMVLETGLEKVVDQRSQPALLWAINKGEFLYMS